MTSSFNKREKAFETSDIACCPVCFKDVEIFSIGICDHPICHECSTRMRVLCKEDACPICRQELTKVYFVKKAKPYQLLASNLYPMDKITKIHFESAYLQDVFEKLLVHICYSCPLKPTFQNLQILKDHLRKEHELFFCDLCVENLKIFSQERRAYTRQELALHRRKGDPDNTSHRGHPLCNFCDQRYVDADELFRHLRRDHYFCHFCDADGLNHYYCNYEDLRKHFHDAHFLCEEGECKDEKFTCVFRTEIDIRAHKAQTHSQSLGKAAIKQARTLELEFTLAPRSGENKGRNGRRVGPRASDKQESNNVAEQQTSRPAAVSSVVSADIGNPEEFPSLSTGSGSVMKSRTNGSDSLAQKLAKSNRFTVKNTVGAHDEFPSLVAEGLAIDHQDILMPGDKKSTGAKRSVRLRLGGQNEDFLTEGTPIARVSRVNTSQNIHVQPSRDLRLENFPSLSLTSPQLPEQQPLKPGWIKKNPPKPVNVSSVKSVSHSRNPPSTVEEYPLLVPSSLHDPGDANVWITSKDKVNNGVTVPCTVPSTESSSKHPKERCKKKKNPPIATNKNQVEALVFSGETKKKVSQIQVGELNRHPIEVPRASRTGRTKFDMSDGLMETNTCIASKVNIIAPQINSKTIENNGARPKIKDKPINLNSSEFPALGNSSPVTSFFDSSHDGSPLTRVEKLAPTKIALTSSSVQNVPLTLNNNSSRAFLQPPDFSVRNQQLIATVMDLLCNQRKKIEKFRTISTQFRSGSLDAKEYYTVK
uniref:RING-type E3 ubiquitin transferase n=1 Tax=Daphnia pulex TaxID=6669 RepID=A0A4Y7MTW5_DAPPU|nr:EOG090X01BP [Daphnia pulex]